MAGVEVGHTTLISGSGKLVVGKGPIRTGVTVVHPRGKSNPDPVFGAWFTLNGNGEMTGTTWLQESGILEGPDRHHEHAQRRRRARRDSAVAGREARGCSRGDCRSSPRRTTAGSTTSTAFTLSRSTSCSALDGAKGGAVHEGTVGGGTGMVCHGFKGGIGTASRRLPPEQGGYTVGVLVQCNYGARRDLQDRRRAGR